MSFFTGTPGRFEKIDLLEKGQQPLKKQLFNASGQGTFGPASDYYRSLLSDNNSTFNAFAAPEQRQFQEETIPGLAEQFAGMGAGGLSSSGFRNAGIQAGTDLAERLGAIRAQLRQQGAAGLQGIGQQALQPFQQNIYRPAVPGFLESVAPLAGAALGAIGGPIGSAIGGQFGNLATSWLNRSTKGRSSPWGASSSGLPSREYIQNFKPPALQPINFMQRP